MYAGRAHLEQRFGTGEIADLAESGNHIDRVDRVLTDASAEIDSRIGVVYALPLPAGQYPLLLAIACDLARAELYDDAEHEAAEALAAQARDLLDKIVAGEAQLVDYVGRLVERRNRAAWRGPARAFTDESLGGLAPSGADGPDVPLAPSRGSGAPQVPLDPSSGGDMPDVPLDPPDPGGGGQAIAIRAGWSADQVASASELTASSTDTVLTIPDASGDLYLVAWRSDAAGGDPDEVHVASARGWRSLFGDAVPLADADGTPGQAIVTHLPQKAALLSGEPMQVL